MLELIGVIIVTVTTLTWPAVNAYYDGSYCVSPTVSVGDTVHTTKDKMTVVKLYGESIRCDHPDRPIRAKLEAQE